MGFEGDLLSHRVVQLAAARGARVIATARPGAEVDFVTGLTGAEVQVVDYTGDLDAQVRAIAPEGVVLHLAGDGVQLAGLLGKDGRIASTLGLTPDAVEGVTVHPIMADPTGRTLTALAEQAAAGTLRVPVTDLSVGAGRRSVRGVRHRDTRQDRRYLLLIRSRTSV